MRGAILLACATFFALTNTAALSTSHLLSSTPCWTHGTHKQPMHLVKLGFGSLLKVDRAGMLRHVCSSVSSLKHALAQPLRVREACTYGHPRTCSAPVSCAAADHLCKYALSNEINGDDSLAAGVTVITLCASAPAAALNRAHCDATGVLIPARASVGRGTNKLLADGAVARPPETGRIYGSSTLYSSAPATMGCANITSIDESGEKCAANRTFLTVEKPCSCRVLCLASAQPLRQSHIACCPAPECNSSP